MIPFTKYLVAFSMAVVFTAAAHTPSQAITGGKLVKDGELPFMRLIETRFPSSKEYFHCSGALISERLILTAAHCAINYSGEKAFEGLIATANSKGELDSESFTRITDVYYPTNYIKHIPQVVDIAILKLEKPVPNAVVAQTLLTAHYPIYVKEQEELTAIVGKAYNKEPTFQNFLRDDNVDARDLLAKIPVDEKGTFIAHAAGYGPTGCIKSKEIKCNTKNGILHRVRLRLSQLSSERQPNGKFNIGCKELSSFNEINKSFCYAQTAQSLVDAPSKINDKLEYGQNHGDSGGPLFAYLKGTQKPMIIGVACCSLANTYQYNVSLAFMMNFLRGVYDPEGPHAEEVQHFTIPLPPK